MLYTKRAYLSNSSQERHRKLFRAFNWVYHDSNIAATFLLYSSDFGTLHGSIAVNSNPQALRNAFSDNLACWWTFGQRLAFWSTADIPWTSGSRLYTSCWPPVTCSILSVPFKFLQCFFSNKAVANGAVSFYIDRCIVSWTATFAYGILCTGDPELLKRSGITISEEKGIPKYFQTIIPKVPSL